MGGDPPPLDCVCSSSTAPALSDNQPSSPSLPPPLHIPQYAVPYPWAMLLDALPCGDPSTVADTSPCAPGTCVSDGRLLARAAVDGVPSPRLSWIHFAYFSLSVIGPAGWSLAASWTPAGTSSRPCDGVPIISHDVPAISQSIFPSSNSRSVPRLITTLDAG